MTATAIKLPFLIRKQSNRKRGPLFQLLHPPTPDTTGLPTGQAGLPVEEGESGANVASADVRPFPEKADEPGEVLLR